MDFSWFGQTVLQNSKQIWSKRGWEKLEYLKSQQSSDVGERGTDQGLAASHEGGWTKSFSEVKILYDSKKTAKFRTVSGDFKPEMESSELLKSLWETNYPQCASPQRGNTIYINSLGV